MFFYHSIAIGKKLNGSNNIHSEVKQGDRIYLFWDLRRNAKKDKKKYATKTVY